MLKANVLLLYWYPPPVCLLFDDCILLFFIFYKITMLQDEKRRNMGFIIDLLHCIPKSPKDIPETYIPLNCLIKELCIQKMSYVNIYIIYLVSIKYFLTGKN